MNKKAIVILLSILLGTPSVNAQVACTTADLTGGWRIFAVTGSNAFTGFGRGTVFFTRVGVVRPALSGAVFSDGTLLRAITGQLRVAPGCRVTGTVFTNIGIRILLVDAQMDSGKTFISGVYRRSDGDVGMINFVR